MVDMMCETAWNEEGVNRYSGLGKACLYTWVYPVVEIHHWICKT
jgi:beta-glucosidase/6-phospho-beta-glucosidase/beta-galactosidase